MHDPDRWTCLGPVGVPGNRLIFALSGYPFRMVRFEGGQLNLGFTVDGGLEMNIVARRFPDRMGDRLQIIRSWMIDPEAVTLFQPQPPPSQSSPNRKDNGDGPKLMVGMMKISPFQMSMHHHPSSDSEIIRSSFILLEMQGIDSDGMQGAFSTQGILKVFKVRGCRGIPRGIRPRSLGYGRYGPCPRSEVHRGFRAGRGRRCPEVCGRCRGRYGRHDPSPQARKGLCPVRCGLCPRRQDQDLKTNGMGAISSHS